MRDHGGDLCTLAIACLKPGLRLASERGSAEGQGLCWALSPIGTFGGEICGGYLAGEEP